MNKLIRALIITSFFYCELHLNGQGIILDFGRVSREEIDLAHCTFDKEAEAIVLYDIGNSYFVRGASSPFNVYFERKTKIKILTNAGLDFANVEIPFYQEGDIYEQVVDLEANTYNFENGRLTVSKLDLKNCYDEKLNDSWTQKKFAMPDVREGSVIEYRYKIISPYVFNLRDWYFQWKIPVLQTQYQVKIIPFYEYSFILQGTTKLDHQTSYVESGLEEQFGGVSYKKMVYEFGMDNVPAFRDETLITSREDYIIKLDFQLSKVTQTSGISNTIITTWPEMIKALLKNDYFGKYTDKVEKSADKIFDIESLNGKNDLEKVKSIISFVKAGYNWNGEKTKFASKSLKDFLDEKTGNTGNINLFLTGLIRASGIEAYPVILSTRDHGKIKLDYPFNHFFNYVIVLVKTDKQTFLADATEVLSPYNQIPVRCINEKGLIISKDEVHWVPLENKISSMIKRKINIVLSPESETQICQINNSYTGYDALNMRNNFNDNVDKIEEEITDNSYKTIDSIKTSGFDDIENQYTVDYSTTIAAEVINNKFYVAPLLEEPISKNPLKQAKRDYPVDMTYPKSRYFYSEIKIPDDYKFENIPENYSLDNSLTSVSYTTQIKDDKLIVSAVYTFKQGVYKAEDYSKIKYYFNQIIKKFNEKAVIVKK